ncbi:transporter substrate-binding domain-containing protein [Streptomyces sp. NBC_00878]|uniref:transporter substrate-binding domain-containing protein n=1 Tax=Streptomyces sp. NBC_00878 TaxID=2975854 RepID=UPI0022529173|nr:transporter substrate-binding domain-containing protein [Streptomyces sp. NBC_00878]MCX4906580.1 transporter substrate-binding domain-containing protein [Streptomyces sp. NBC_00878]
MGRSESGNRVRAGAPGPRPTATAAIAAAVLLVLATGCSSSPSSITDDGRVEVGAKSDQPGTSFSPHDGEYNGFDITVVRELLRTMGIDEPDFEGVLSKNRDVDLRSGDLELVAATFSITADRMKPEDEGGKDLDFAGPYASTHQGILVRAADYGRYGNLSDLKGKQVCVWESTTSADELKSEAYDGISVRTETDANYCVKALREGEVDAVSTDRLILFGFMAAEPGLKVVPGIKFGTPNDYGIAMAKGHRKDCEKLRDALKKYVTGNDWARDFALNLPEVPKAERDEAQPTTADIEALSCRDKPANATAD